MWFRKSPASDIAPPEDEPLLIERSSSYSRLPLSQDFPFSPNSPVDTSNAIYAKVMMPYESLNGSRRRELIDSRILFMMAAAEEAMITNGDIWEAFISQIELAGGELTINHPDDQIAAAYREWWRRIAGAELLEDVWLDSLICGQGYLIGAGEGDEFTFLTLNPRHVAIGAQTQIGSRPIVFFPGSSSFQDLRQEFYHNGGAAPEWNEWRDIGDANGILLDARRVICVHVVKQSSYRYAIPPIIRAWDDVIGRMRLEEMRQSTIEGVKSQIRLWTLKNPRRGEIAKLASLLRQHRGDRIYDLAWEDNIAVKQVLPGVIDALMAQEMWVNYTASIFRRLGMFMRLVSGETLGEAHNYNSKSIEVEVLIALSRLRRGPQRMALRAAHKMMNLYATFGDPTLAKYPPPALSFQETALSTSELVRGVYVPLLNYGMVSAQTVHQGTGIDHEVEMQRLQRELPMRRSGLISPYTGFAQAGPRGVFEHPLSPGRPEGADLDPDHAEINRRNAQGN